jgi:hypothetical protein
LDLLPERAATRGLADAALLILALALFAAAVLQLVPFLPDDSFITYRYAANLADGHGLRFNPADAPVEGYSNFLWIVLLAWPAALGLDPAATSVWFGALLGGGCILLLWLLLRRRGRAGWHLAVPVGLLALSGPLLLYSISGMETALFVFILLATLLAADVLLAKPTVGRGLSLAAVATLAALARPEGVLVFPVVAACLALSELRGARERRRALWRVLAVAGVAFVAIQAAYHLWRVSYFNAFWPTPFLSKGTSGDFSSIIDSWAVNLRQFFVRQTHYYMPMAYYYAALALPAAVGAALALRRGDRRPIEWTALVLALMHALVYMNFTDWMPGMRYFAPLTGLLLIPFSLLGPELHSQEKQAADGTGDLAYLLLGATLAILSLFSLAALRLDSQQLQASTQASLVELGHWLRQTMPADTVLAMSDVGATPYYSGLHTVDINPQSLTDRFIAENGWSADYFFAVDPDVVVLTAFSLDEPDFYGVYEDLFSRPRFQLTYERIGVVRNDWYQDRSYWVFVRQGMTPSAEGMMSFPTGIRKP